MTKAFLLAAITCLSTTASAYDFSAAFDELRNEERRIEFLLDEDRFENIGGFHQETYLLKENYDNCESDGSWPFKSKGEPYAVVKSKFYKRH